MKIKCLLCNDIIESMSLHDCKYCKCEACSIDGGKQYTRIGGDFDKIVVVNEDGTEKPVSEEEKNKIVNNYSNFLSKML